MFNNLSDKLDKALHVLKGRGSITEINVAETLKESFWTPIFANTDFKQYLKDKYEVGHAEMIKSNPEDLDI